MKAYRTFTTFAALIAACFLVYASISSADASSKSEFEGVLATPVQSFPSNDSKQVFKSEKKRELPRRIKAKQGKVDGTYKQKVIAEFKLLFKGKPVDKIEAWIKEQDNVEAAQARALAEIWEEYVNSTSNQYWIFTDDIFELLGKLKNQDTLEDLLGDVLAEDTNNQVRLQYFRSVTGAPYECWEEFLVQECAEDVPATLRLLSAKALARGGSELGANVVLALLRDPAWRVRKSAVESAAKYVEKSKSKYFDFFVEPVITLMVAEGRTGGFMIDVIRKNLEEMTGVDLGEDPGNWLRWYRRHKSGKGMSKEEIEEARKGEVAKGRKTWGVYSGSKRVIYIIDNSHSMSQKIPKEEKNTTGGKRGKDEGDDIDWEKIDTRLDLARYELLKSIDKLPEDAQFNIISYNSSIKVWKLEKKEFIFEANEKNKEEAKEWVNALNTSGATNIYGAIGKSIEIAEMAIAESGKGKKKKKKKKRSRDAGNDQEGTGAFVLEEDEDDNVPDTVFFLTDGHATDGKYKDDQRSKDSREVRYKKYKKIMDAMVDEIETRNDMASLVIHCIGISKDADTYTLKKLSKACNGEFRHLAVGKK